MTTPIMYSPPSPFATSSSRASAMYSKIGLETMVFNASPHRLVAMLFDGVFESMSQAIIGIQTRNNELKSRNLIRCVRILDEGLKSALNMDAGSLSKDLNDLYAYLCMRLTYANLHSDVDAIMECRNLLQPVKDAWLSIGEEVVAKKLK